MALTKTRAQRRSYREKQLSYASRVYRSMGHTEAESQQLALRTYKI
jgi:hypothetical protein